MENEANTEFSEPTLAETEAPKKRGRPKKEQAPEKPKTYVVRLLRNYRPMDKFEVVEGNQTRAPSDVERQKMFAGAMITLDLNEARNVVDKKIAERADEFG